MSEQKNTRPQTKVDTRKTEISKGLLLFNKMVRIPPLTKRLT